MQAPREKGLSCNCDEKFAPSHKCKNQQLSLLEPIDEMENLVIDDMVEE